MKKINYILVILIAISFKTLAQIPNDGFENWTTVGSCIEPIGWHSMYYLADSTGNFCPVTRSSDHYPASIGSYSLMIENDTALWNTGMSPGNMPGWGMITSTKMNDKPLFPITGHPKALCGYYKFLPQNGDTMNIDVHFYKSGTEIASGAFQSSVTVSGWTSFKIFVDDTNYISVDSARISMSCSNEPKNGGGPRGNSTLYIDNLSFDDLITSVSDQVLKNTFFNFYPNPASDVISLDINNPVNENLEINIYDVVGTLVKSEKLKPSQQQISISDLNNGIYMITLKSKDLIANKRLMIQK